jgi:hypothetical protein
MRQAAVFTAVAWFIVVAFEWLLLPRSFQNVLHAIAVGLTLLWLLHVVVYAVRFARNSSCSTPDDGFESHPTTHAADRRDYLLAFAKGAAAAVTVSAPVMLWSSTAFAFCGQCTKAADCGTCRCVNTAPVNSGRVCNECVCP